MIPAASEIKERRGNSKKTNRIFSKTHSVYSVYSWKCPHSFHGVLGITAVLVAAVWAGQGTGQDLILAPFKHFESQLTRFQFAVSAA